jgi:hypothetical protein
MIRKRDGEELAISFQMSTLAVMIARFAINCNEAKGVPGRDLFSSSHELPSIHIAATRALPHHI